jgi:hypothetical protein
MKKISNIGVIARSESAAVGKLGSANRRGGLKTVMARKAKKAAEKLVNGSHNREMA